MSGSKARSAAARRRTPQHRVTGRHRQQVRTVAELTDLPATTGVKFAAVGLLASTAAVAVPALASAGTLPGSSSIGATPPAVGITRPVIKVVVIGDSYTSGEGDQLGNIPAECSDHSH